jgi:hypothetical protein
MGARSLTSASFSVEDPVVGTSGHDPEDWLDACCWRCGASDPAEDSLGRLLCRPCIGALADQGSTLPVDPLGVVRGAYWDAHVLECCWRCLTGSVDPTDDVGLCAGCRAFLAGAVAGSQEVAER